MYKMPLIGKLGCVGTYKNILMKSDAALHEQVADVVQRTIPYGARVLDLGAGEGALSLRLADLAYQVVAADANEEQFKCRDKVNFYKLDFNNRNEMKTFVKKYNNSFDVVLGVEIIEHVENPWEYIRMLRSLCKNGGTIIVTTPNVSSWLSRLKFLFTGEFISFSDRDYDSSGHINPVSAWEIRHILQAEGLRDFTIEPAGKLPLFVVGRSAKMYLMNILHALFRPVMRGIKDGWCLLVVAKV